MKCYKLTDQNDQTLRVTQWGPGVRHRTDGRGDLCGPGWLHFYRDPVVAAMLDPRHAHFGPTAHLWEADADGEILDNDYGLKAGTTDLTTQRVIPLPVLTLHHMVKFAILCAQRVSLDPSWDLWAARWLSGLDRTAVSANSQIAQQYMTFEAYSRPAMLPMICHAALSAALSVERSGPSGGWAVEFAVHAAIQAIKVAGVAGVADQDGGFTQLAHRAIE